MNQIMFFDSETNGLPNWSLPSEDPSQPHIVQLCAQVCEEETGKTINSMNVIIKPDGWTIPDDVANIHGITTEHALEVGVPESMALMMFLDMWHGILRIAHNESFDARIIRIAMLRHKLGDADAWKASPAYCTMNNSLKILNLPPSERMLAAGKKGPKSPNLSEAYLHFTGMALDGAHNAAMDVMACKVVYYGIRKYRNA